MPAVCMYVLIIRINFTYFSCSIYVLDNITEGSLTGRNEVLNPV